MKRVKSKKILGVIFDQSLGWHDHIDSVCKKGLGVLRRIRDVVPSDSLIKVFNATIQPHRCGIIAVNALKINYKNCIIEQDE